MLLALQPQKIKEVIKMEQEKEKVGGETHQSPSCSGNHIPNNGRQQYIHIGKGRRMMMIWVLVSCSLLHVVNVIDCLHVAT